MSYAISKTTLQPATAAVLLDFVNGPFAYLNVPPAIRRATQLAILNAMQSVYNQYPAINQTTINQIITQIKILTSQQLAAGRPV